MRRNVQYQILNTRFAQDPKDTKLCVLCAFVFNSLVFEIGIEQ